MAGRSGTWHRRMTERRFTDFFFFSFFHFSLLCDAIEFDSINLKKSIECKLSMNFNWLKETCAVNELDLEEEEEEEEEEEDLFVVD